MNNSDEKNEIALSRVHTEFFEDKRKETRDTFIY